MSIDGRLQVLWRSELGDAEPPLDQREPSVPPQQQAEGRNDSTQDVPPTTVVVPVGPQGPHSPETNEEARNCRAERRDRWRLGIEFAALWVGVIGIVGLYFTFRESRRAAEAALQSVIIARQQMELSERPWISVVDVMLTRARMSFRADTLGRFEVSLKNVGHSVAKEIEVEAEMMIYPNPTEFMLPHPGPAEMRKRVEDLCERMRVGGVGETSGLVLFPEQQGILNAEMATASGQIESKSFEQSGEPGKFVDPYLIGCVVYKSIFTVPWPYIRWPYVTRFVYRISTTLHQQGFFRVGETVSAEDIRLEPSLYSGAYID